MKKSTLTGSATAALGVAVVAGASPALATTLTQGAALSVPAGQCSITVVSDTTAYTAEHCGAGQWTVGSPIDAADGTEIGTVAALPGDSRVDAVKIALADDVDVVGDWSTRPAETVQPGETVYTHGSSVPLGNANTVSDPTPYDIGATCGDAYSEQVSLDAATTRPGDSGGAVYDAEQRVVGVVSGLAPVSFDAEGRAVSCDASQLSTIMVPVESLDEVDVTAPAQAPTVGKHGVASLTDSERRALELEKAEAAKAEATAQETAAAEKKAAAAEKKAAAEAKAQKAAAAEKKAATAAKAESASAAGELTITAAPAQGIARGTRVQANTDEGGFSYMAVTAYDADGDRIGHLHLHSDGQPMAWINVPATVPAGGHITVEVKDAAGQPTDTTVTLGGTAIN